MIGDGALTVQDLVAIWTAAVDEGYSAPFLAAGDGGGLEAYTQGFAQYSRVSSAVDNTLQACYIMPFSGQTAPPAGGEQKATVTLTFTRTKRLELPLRIAAGQVFFDEQTDDWGPTGAVPILTGRRYTLQQDIILLPGFAGPINGVAIAEQPGSGYNNPLPGTIKVIDQVGNDFVNDSAKVVNNYPTIPLTFNLVTANKVDTFVPEHVGQYIALTSGPDAGQILRINSFAPPQPNAVPPTGSTVGIEPIFAMSSASVAGTFLKGEVVNVMNGGTLIGTVQFLYNDAPSGGRTRLAFVVLNNAGGISSGAGYFTLIGQQTGATATFDTLLYLNSISITLNNTSWAVLDWALDLGVSVTNSLSPTGGRAGMLDELGYDRDLPRNTGETDDPYRTRIHQVADIVAPNAIRRMLNRVLGSTSWCFREAGGALLPGFFCDRDACDYNVVTFTGSVTRGTFVNPNAAASYQEKVEYRDASGLLKARGFLGNTPGASLVLIPTDGAGSRQQPFIGVAAGDIVVGLSSGAVYGVTGFTPNLMYPSLRFRVDLDYIDFRGFFLIGVPPGGAGEFGVAFDSHPQGFFDAVALANFFDGDALATAALYQRLYQAVDSIRAGGTTFDIYQELGACI